MHSGAQKLPVRHLSIRLPWHDTGWTGTVCKAPSKNNWCMVLKSIHENRDDAAEDACAGQTWIGAGDAARPACKSERGAALNASAYTLTSRHPFAKSSATTHGHFADNNSRIPPYSVQAIPYRWTRKDNAQEIADTLTLPFDGQREPKIAFETPWVDGFENQQIMLDTFFGALRPQASLVFLYVKRTPLADDPRRVLVGVGRVTSVGPAQEHAYENRRPGQLQGLMWERAVSPSIRPDGIDGFVLPYQALLALSERDGSLNPSQFVAFAPDEAFDAFSNVAEHVDHDLAIACLLVLAEKVRLVAQHVPGRWDCHLEWISARLAELWQLRGAFPGLASALHAFDVRDGTLLAMDLAQRHAVDGGWREDPWTLISRAFQSPHEVLSPAVAERVQSFDGKRPAALEPERFALLKLLSRFGLTIKQATRFFAVDRHGGLTDGETLRNPYRLFETDRHNRDAVSIGAIDRGMFPDASVRTTFPLPEISRLEGDQDPRRVRALAVAVLTEAEAAGHTLLPMARVLEAIGEMELDPPCRPTRDLLPLLDPHMAPEVVATALADGARAWQFGERRKVDDLLRASRSAGASASRRGVIRPGTTGARRSTPSSGRCPPSRMQRHWRIEHGPRRPQHWRNCSRHASRFFSPPPARRGCRCSATSSASKRKRSPSSSFPTATRRRQTVGRSQRLARALHPAGEEFGLLKDVASTDLLQAVSLFSTREIREAAIAAGRTGKDVPGINANRQALLNLPLAHYRRYVDHVEDGFVRAAKFLHRLHIYRPFDLPYQSQLVPLAAILADLGDTADHDTVRRKIAEWYWNGVFGELYGSTTETRFARDFVEVPAWIADGPVPTTIRDATFRADRLVTMRTRLSAAYKGVNALLMNEGARDFRTGLGFDLAVFFGENVDIHHIFPKAWCQKKGIWATRYDSIINKTPLSARTNRIIGGHAPSEYLRRLKKVRAVPLPWRRRRSMPTSLPTSSIRPCCGRTTSTRSSPLARRSCSASSSRRRGKRPIAASPAPRWKRTSSRTRFRHTLRSLCRLRMAKALRPGLKTVNPA